MSATDMAIPIESITGLVLAGGRGSRMGGVDKGLQSHLGMPLALHALLRLAPQVGEVMISANRNLAAYEAMGVPVWPDPIEDYAGPLAGLLAGLEHAQTEWLVTVPCDSPNFPLDLVARLAAAAAEQDAEIAMAALNEEGQLRRQPVFCLLRTSLVESLVAFLHAGERKVDRWTARHRMVEVVFDEPADFANANTTDELRQLQR
ncbi:molybdenum cofactor guanylyltransferase MobA [Variovorax dokdonensis]|uniref:Molybdenum cofactor guanylyltransferase n=1 Tax=Variovorax dokdonensis TaxID=344883 RepID=A0ABT7NA90_9BURK|nr:molybdenum cofactor guanylyltransferase MobA [Variovorax dokdonensis]MDM0044838.1 molybdenum cofactor guanylyltransferase MobA [Variovorax dokdonensis]